MKKLVFVLLVLVAGSVQADDLQRAFDIIDAYYDQREADNRRYYEEADQRRAVNEILARERMEARDRGDYVPNNTYMKDLACTGYSHDCD
jgi:hypothetical protein